MDKLSFDDLKYLVTLVKVDYTLLSDGDVPESDDGTPVVDVMSDCEYDKLHTFICLLQQLYSHRPLPF